MLKFTATLFVALSLAASAHAAAPAPESLQSYAGQYALTDGRVLTIIDNGGTLTAQIAKRSATLGDARFSAPKTITLKPSGPARFASTTTPLEITFAADATGDVAQVNLAEQGAPMQGLAQR